MATIEISAFWFRRDLRLEDNHGLSRALASGKPVLAVFIFDTEITDELPRDDPRVNFIHTKCEGIDRRLKQEGSSLLVRKGKPLDVWREILADHPIKDLYLNHDYEPYARKRDGQVEKLCQETGVGFHTFKDQVIFEKEEVLKQDNHPYTVFTPYSKKWLSNLSEKMLSPFEVQIKAPALFRVNLLFPSLEDLGFSESRISVKPYDLSVIDEYDEHRDIPSEDSGSYLGPHLRFGTVSVRSMVALAREKNQTFLSELIWREFFSQILYHYPRVVDHAFREKYDKIEWVNDTEMFERWKQGTTGYPMVDAGMRQLNETGYMHNRVRMVTASFLCKHLLIDWRWGEAYFAKKLLDYELASNNGNWQWAAGTGCDAAPYFRIFNPWQQQKKFDPEFSYIRTWVREFNKPEYPEPIVAHKYARERALATYKKALD